ncbi:MAG: hypothetical protein GY701_13265, partial [Sulfitobacter sp.]|nr:hypothetical protein [Sulfitobacter sp.]
CGGEGSMGTEAQRSLADSDAFYTAPPSGPGYQLWETVGDSPMSPVFEGPAELAVWMSTHPCVLGPLGSRGMVPMDEGRALKFIGVGSAPSVVMSDGTLASGTDWVAGKAEEEA